MSTTESSNMPKTDSFYSCTGYIVAQCPPGQAFNPSISFCDNPANVPGCTFFDIDRYLKVGLYKFGRNKFL